MDKKLSLAFWGLMICLLISLGFSLVYKYDNEKIKKLDISTVKLNEDKYVYSIDDIQNRDGVIYIYGHAAELGKDTVNVNRQFVLLDGETALGIQTVLVERADATAYFNDGFNYDNIGLNGRALSKYLEDGKTYQIAILTKDGGEPFIIKTDRFITNKEVLA